MNARVKPFPGTRRHKSEGQSSAGTFAHLRQQYGLTQSEAAKAMETTKDNILVWEEHGTGPSADFIIERFAAYRLRHVVGKDSNLLFGCYPLRMARDVLGMSLANIALQYGYSEHGWQKFESNQRVLSRVILHEVEDEVRDHLAANCQLA